MWTEGSHEEKLKGREGMKFWQHSARPNWGKLENSNHVEVYGESTVHGMPIFSLLYYIELAGNSNPCIKNKQKFRALLDSGAEVSLIHTKVYKYLKNKPKLKKQTALLQSVKRDSIYLDRCALIEYEIGKKKQEHEFFLVLQMNRNIILVRDWLKQFCVHMYYDLGCVRAGKSYTELEYFFHGHVNH